MKIRLTDIALGVNYSRTFGTGDISELVASMKKHGQLAPIIVDEDNTLVAGFRRYAAAVELGWTELEATVTATDPKIANLIENLNREDPSLWEEIQGIRDVFGTQPQQADIARALSKSKSWVRPRVMVWTLPQEFIDKVRSGQSGVKEIKRCLAEIRGPSAVSRNMGIPSQPDVKRMVSWLIAEGRTIEATALSFACGTITDAELREMSHDG